MGRTKSMEVRPVKQCLDANGNVVRAGQIVESHPLYTTDGTIVRGRVKGTFTRNLIEVKHLSGQHKGQVWRSAAKLWKAV